MSLELHNSQPITVDPSEISIPFNQWSQPKLYKFQNNQSEMRWHNPRQEQRDRN